MNDLLRSPQSFRDRLTQVKGQLDTYRREQKRLENQRLALERYLEVSHEVSTSLDTLSEKLFQQRIKVLEEKLTLALQEVLEQPLVLKAHRSFKRTMASIEFFIEKEGKSEDILKGQGGSVANVLSVCLRMFALTTLDPKEHRRFIVLDEQDCWLRPDLVPRFVKIVQMASRELGFQVLMISHHEISAFEGYADRILQLNPGLEGVQVKKVAENLHN